MRRDDSWSAARALARRSNSAPDRSRHTANNLQTSTCFPQEGSWVRRVFTVPYTCIPLDRDPGGMHGVAARMHVLL